MPRPVNIAPAGAAVVVVEADGAEVEAEEPPRDPKGGFWEVSDIVADVKALEAGLAEGKLNGFCGN